jgi:hypothetical protein
LNTLKIIYPNQILYMSGPKSYAPPPRYSLSVFNGKLNEAFLLQSRLKNLLHELEGYRFQDNNLNIVFDCKEMLGKIRHNINTSLKEIVFDYTGTFGQATYNKIDQELDSRIIGLAALINECETIKNDFLLKQQDYTSYISYCKFFDSSVQLFGEFKKQVIDYLKKNIADFSPEICKEATDGILSVEPEISKTEFRFGFHSLQELEKNKISGYISEREEEIHKIRSKTSDHILEGTGKTLPVYDRSVSISPETGKLIQKIKAIIKNCDDPEQITKYETDLKNLLDSRSSKDIYFFKELHDSVLENEKTRNGKIYLNNALAELNNVPIHPSLKNEFGLLIRQCMMLLNNSSVNNSQVDGVNNQIFQIKRQNKFLFEEDEIKSKERLFLKSQLILLLENQGYEVMDDLEVIDFEKTDDFLLKIKGQENYINVKFREDGSMRYVFQIPENKDDLSTDQVKTKLHEMHVTCTEFHSILKDLNKMGLKLDVIGEKPIELDSIISVTNQYKDKIKVRKSSVKQIGQVRKKYFNR